MDRVFLPPGESPMTAMAPAACTCSTTALTTSGWVVTPSSGGRDWSRLGFTSTRLPARTTAPIPPRGTRQEATAARTWSLS